ncbi:MAG: tryptophan synthase subunit alpha [Candidatus Omnitrophota bacterium]|jgi:tryptophan synthase alpha chain|nr:tryptophan synthase subunit alpha [Candidatus Omnitrophota bacterium]
MNRIDATFRKLRKTGRRALIPFVTAGYPGLAATEKIVLGLEAAGADVIELGVPFSDPIADGPVIQMSSFEALKKGVTLKDVLGMVRRLRRRTQVPLVAMTYFNPVLQYGPRRFVGDALTAGLDGVIIPDLPPQEEKDFQAEARRKGFAVVLFISPTTPPARARAIAKRAKGFIYFVSLAGVTGARRKLPADLKARLTATKRIAGRTPVCVGFGVSSPKQVRELGPYCDGVIVGSAVVNKIREGLRSKDYVAKVAAFIRNLKGEHV